MRIWNYNTVWEGTSPAEIGRILSTSHGNRRNAFRLSHGEKKFPAINIMVSGELAYVHYFPKERHPGFASVGLLLGLKPDGNMTCFPDDTDEPLENMNNAVVGANAFKDNPEAGTAREDVWVFARPADKSRPGMEP
jgi:hypothetical protein